VPIGHILAFWFPAFSWTLSCIFISAFLSFVRSSCWTTHWIRIQNLFRCPNSSFLVIGLPLFETLSWRLTCLCGPSTRVL
jgi:hypothetical protein